MVSMGLTSTSSRVIRGPKAKLFLYICAVLVITGLVACYNSTLSQLDEVKKSNFACHRQQENLSTQLQVISDYKQKLEKSLKYEKAEHQQTKNSWEVQFKEEKNRGQELSNNAQLKYNSLQQHFNLLQTEFDDFKAESSTIQKKQLDEINSLQAKLQEVEEELKKIKGTKESIKSQLVDLEIQNSQLKNALQKAEESESQRTLKMYNEEFQFLYGKYENLRKKCGEPPDEKVNTLNALGLANKPSEKSVVNLPLLKMAENPSSSTKAVPKMSPSEGVLNGARPMNAPTVTPESVKKEVNLKPPQGVVEPPENRENQNEQPQVDKQKIEKVDEAEKDNLAQEVFDNNEGLGFAENALKPGLSNELPQKGINIDSKKHEEQDYKDLQREEEGGDDDADEYGPPRGEEAAVRN